MKYEVTAPGQVTKEIWQEISVRRLSGGFNILVTAALASFGWLKKGTPIAIDFATRNATPIFTSKLTANAAADATAFQVAKGSLFSQGDFIGTKTKSVTVTTVDKSNPSYDVINTDAAIGALASGAVLTRATATGSTNKLVTGDIVCLNYADVKIDGQVACSGVIQAWEVKQSLLPYPLTDDIKTALTSRFIFMP